MCIIDSCIQSSYDSPERYDMRTFKPAVGRSFKAPRVRVRTPKPDVFTRYQNGTGEPNDPPRHGDTVYKRGERYIFHGPKGEYLPLKEYQQLKRAATIYDPHIYAHDPYVDRRASSRLIRRY
jgi:hypothetical protein